MSLIEIVDLKKHFKVLNRREGIIGSIKDLLSGDYRIVKAVDGISFSIKEGEIVGFLGPNGAGKSTTIKMMIGALVPTSGTITINGFTPHKDRESYVRNIGIVFGQRSQLWWDIPVIESYKVLREIYEISRTDFDKNMELFRSLGDFSALLNTPVRNLSLGQRALCDILAAFLHNPKIVFLDEPTIGLDVSVKSKVRDLILTLNKINKTTIVLTSHDISDIESLCERIIVIDKGKVIYDGKTEHFHSLFGSHKVLRIKLPEGLSAADVSSAIFDCFPGANSISVKNSGKDWVNVIFNEQEYKIVEILDLLLKEIKFVDLQVDSAGLSDLIKRVYEGGVA